MCAGNGETEAVAQGKGRRRPMFHVKHLCVITRAPACIFFERHTQQTESSLRFFRHAPSSSAGISRKSKSPRICFHRCGGWVIRYRGSLCGALVLDDLRDGAHGAFLDAVAARNAGILVHNVSLAANNLEHFLRAGVDADATANALIGIDNRVRHIILLLVQNTREHTGNFPKNLLPARYHGSMQMQEKSAIFQGAVRILSWMLGVRASSVKAARLRVCGQRRGARERGGTFRLGSGARTPTGSPHKSALPHTAKRPLQNLDPPARRQQMRGSCSPTSMSRMRVPPNAVRRNTLGPRSGCAAATSPMIAASAP